ncbi:TPA: type II toxin-antitoxin system VapC family toxin, partial [Candidatus Bathyarchaeota archaeon]|nr:type II toxin-antitoxin system VapC family toxin [Candidatus Bathyarchaeota archaeon]
KIVPVNQQIAIKAGEINHERKGMEKIRGWGMIDSTVLATAQIHKAKVLTGDPHFKNLKETIWLSKHP